MQAGSVPACNSSISMSPNSAESRSSYLRNVSVFQQLFAKVLLHLEILAKISFLRTELINQQQEQDYCTYDPTIIQEGEGFLSCIVRLYLAS